MPVHVASQRLGLASPVVTMTVYAHLLPGSQREAANLFAQLAGKVGMMRSIIILARHPR